MLIVKYNIINNPINTTIDISLLFEIHNSYAYLYLNVKILINNELIIERLKKPFNNDKR